ncbi:hypothetical protein B0H13DRAFT_2373202 [Mycena leptocephala]|nr:hypothetical protein B0H13DRAFT_2373202 [Mycena leptocephala]
MQAQTYFESPTDWDSEYAKFPSTDPAFFCNVSAYSQRKSNRGIHLVQLYWTTISTPDCPDWEVNTRDGSYDFKGCYKFLKASNPLHFQEIGGLIAFLLTADFAYAGAVKMPSVLLVGQLVRDINAGGMKGLELLELITPHGKGTGSSFKKGNVGEVQAGFSQLHEFLDSKLSDVTKTHMGFDVIMQENSCAS